MRWGRGADVSLYVPEPICVVDIHGKLGDLVAALREPEPRHSSTTPTDAATGITCGDVERRVSRRNCPQGFRERVHAIGIGLSQEYEREVELVDRQPADHRVERSDFGQRLPGARGSNLGEWRSDEQAPASGRGCLRQWPWRAEGL